MRVKVNWMLIPALGLALAFGTAWAFSQSEELGGPEPGLYPGGGAGMGLGMMGELEEPGLREELGLTDEQVSSLRTLAFDGAKSGLRTRSELMLKRLELEELLQAEEPDSAAIDQKLRELADARYTHMKQRIEHRLAVRRLLTPEQRQKLRKMRLRRRHRRREFLRRHREGRPPLRRGPHREGFGRGPGFGRDFGPGFDPDFAPVPPPGQ